MRRYIGGLVIISTEKELTCYHVCVVTCSYISIGATNREYREIGFFKSSPVPPIFSARLERHWYMCIEAGTRHDISSFRLVQQRLVGRIRGKETLYSISHDARSLARGRVTSSHAPKMHRFGIGATRCSRAQSSIVPPSDVFTLLERSPHTRVSIPPSSERGVARRSSQAVRLSAGITYSRWVGVARRSTEWRGVARSGATRRGERRCRSMLGCSRYEGRKVKRVRRRNRPMLSPSFTSSLVRPLSIGVSIPVTPANFLRLESRGAISLERRQRPGGACAPRRGSSRLIVAKPVGEGKGAPPYSIPRSSSVHPTIGCRAAPLPPLATAPLPGPPRSPHSVLGITAYSIELDARRQGARQRPPAFLCSTDYICLSLFLTFLLPDRSFPSSCTLPLPLLREEDTRKRITSHIQDNKRFDRRSFSRSEDIHKHCDREIFTRN